MNTKHIFEPNLNLNIETIGTLNLKITRLERRLHVLEQQQLLSDPYPDHKVRLAQKSCQMQSELDYLKEYRQMLLHQGGCRCMNRRSHDGGFRNQGKTNFAFN